jgi:hypothetical protein
MADDTEKLNVFISYSRDDLVFADQLVAALKAAGFATSIDRTMPGGEEWQKRLIALIRDADSVVFVLSPSSVSSKWCRWEVNQAAERGKRILPALCRPLEDASPPPQLAALNYIYFYPEPKSPGSGWGMGIEQLASALNTDLDWLREHTRYLQRAEEWVAGRRGANRLLSGSDIEAAKAWASSRPTHAPEPTELQRDFIKASETEEIREQSAEAQRLKEIAEAQTERGKALAEREEAHKREAVALAEREEAQKRESAALAEGKEAQKREAVALAERETAQKREAKALAEGQEAQNRAAKALAEREEAQKREAEALADGEEAQRRAAKAQKRFTWAAIAGLVVALGLLGAAGWQYSNATAQSKIAQQEREAANQAKVEAQSNAAQAQASAAQAQASLRDARKAREDAEMAKKDALEARDRMHVIGSQSLASLADLKRQGGDATTAALLALEGLPSPGEADRLYTSEPEAALYLALYDVRERSAAPADGRPSVNIDLGGAMRSIDLRGGGVSLGKHDFSAASKRRVRHGQDPDQLLLFDTSKEGLGSSDVLLADLGKYPADSEWAKTSTTFSPDGSRLLASGDKGIVWNAITGARITELKAYQYPAAAAFSADNRILATTATLYDAKNVELWELRTRRQIKSFDAGHRDAIKDIALSRDGKTLVTCADDRSCRVWTVPDARLVTTLTRLSSNTNPVFSPDGSLFFVGSRPISVWDTKAWQPVTSLGIDGVDIIPDMVTADGAFLITHDEKNTGSQVWDLRFQGSPGIAQTLKRPDGAPMLEEPLGLRLLHDSTVQLSVGDRAKSDDAKTHGMEFSAKSGTFLGPTGNVSCYNETAAEKCNPEFEGLAGIILNGFEEVDVKSYSTEIPHQLTVDAVITLMEDNSPAKVKAKLDLGATKPEDIQRVSVDVRRKLIAAEVAGNRLLLGAWDADRPIADVSLGEDTFGWILTPRGDRLALVSLRRLTIVDLKGRLIAKFDGKSITAGSGLTLINYNADFSQIAVRRRPDPGLQALSGL